MAITLVIKNNHLKLIITSAHSAKMAIQQCQYNTKKNTTLQENITQHFLLFLTVNMKMAIKWAIEKLKTTSVQNKHVQLNKKSKIEKSKMSSAQKSTNMIIRIQLKGVLKTQHYSHLLSEEFCFQCLCFGRQFMRVQLQNYFLEHLKSVTELLWIGKI